MGGGFCRLGGDQWIWEVGRVGDYHGNVGVLLLGAFKCLVEGAQYQLRMFQQEQRAGELSAEIGRECRDFFGGAGLVDHGISDGTEIGGLALVKMGGGG